MDTMTSICNMALANADQRSGILDVATEQTPEADRCRQWYDVSRRLVLATYDWTFARKRVALTPHEDEPGDDFAFRYQYPLDCLALREIMPFVRRRKQARRRIEIAPNGTRSILVNVGDALARYTFDQRETLVFSPHFSVALSFVLASHIVGPMTGKDRKKDLLLAQARDAVMAGATADAETEVDQEPPDAPWIVDRDTLALAGRDIFDIDFSVFGDGGAVASRVGNISGNNAAYTGGG